MTKDALDVTDPLDGVYFFGKKLKRDVRDDLLTATISSALDQVTQIELVFHDPGFKRLAEGIYKPRIPVIYEDYKLEVGTVSTVDNSGAEGVGIRCRPRAVRKLKARRGRKVLRNSSPTDFVKSECAAIGHKVVAQPSAKRKQVARDVQGAGKNSDELDNKPSSWTTFQRFASEIGFVVFESAGVIYFGKPSWLLKQSKDKAIEIDWRGPDEDRPFEVPSCTKSVENEITEVSLVLPVKYAKCVRVGKALKLKGVPAFNGTYLITAVDYDLIGATSISVTATTPDDPDPQGWKQNSKRGKGNGGGDGGSGDGDGSGATSGRKGTKFAGDFVLFALRQTGDAYVWGAEASPSNPNPSAFDCSELVEWAAAQAGVFIPDGSQNQRAFCRTISISQAIRTRGALLFTSGHVAISLGNGRTIEAVGTGYGVRQMSATSRSFSWAEAGLIPGMRY